MIGSIRSNGFIGKMIKAKALKWDEFCWMVTGEGAWPDFHDLYLRLLCDPRFRNVSWEEEDSREDPQAVLEIGVENCGVIFSIQGETTLTIEEQFNLKDEFKFDL